MVIVFSGAGNRELTFTPLRRGQSGRSVVVRLTQGEGQGTYYDMTPSEVEDLMAVLNSLR